MKTLRIKHNQVTWEIELYCGVYTVFNPIGHVVLTTHSRSEVVDFLRSKGITIN